MQHQWIKEVSFKTNLAAFKSLSILCTTEDSECCIIVSTDKWTKSKVNLNPSICCHLNPSSCSNRCFLFECLYTILGRPYWYPYEQLGVIECMFTHTSQTSELVIFIVLYKLIFRSYCQFFQLIPVQLPQLFIPLSIQSKLFCFVLSLLAPLYWLPLTPLFLRFFPAWSPVRSNWST